MHRIFCKNILSHTTGSHAKPTATTKAYTLSQWKITLQSIFYILRDACHELFCVFGDFYASGTQDAEVTKSLKAMGNPQPQPSVTALPIAYSCSNWKVVDSVPAQGLGLLF